MNERALYIHVPWCRRRCPYCNFYIVVGKAEDSFAQALIDEWRARSQDWHQGQALSLYFGGGTPSLLRPDQIGRIINFFVHEHALKPHAEITLEANPEDITDDYAKALKDTGVNRISLGTQSFANEQLKLLGRVHTSADAERSLDILQKYDFKNISVDIIIGVPGEESKTILKQLSKLSMRNINHISAYLLTIEEKTNFAKRIALGKLKLCEDKQADIYAQVQAELKNLAYEQYDISSYAKANFKSEHNQVYWSLGTYLGLGPGAHSMRLLADGSVERAHNRARLNSWLLEPHNKNFFDIEKLDAAQALAEALAFGLRNMEQGIDPHALALRHRCALPLNWESIVKKLQEYGWLENKTSGNIAISARGALFADAVMREILCA